MKDFERVRDIKRAARARLLAIPGVHAVAVGPKIVGGKSTDETAIMVFVVKKRPLLEVPVGQRIPTEIEGVKTDVYECGIFRLLAEDDSKYRPLLGGTLITPGDFVDPTPTVLGKALGGHGTLGCFARTQGANPTVVALTCQHVVGCISVAAKATLNSAWASSTQELDFTGTNTPGTTITVGLFSSSSAITIFYQTTDTDTPKSIVAGVAARITTLGAPHFSATPSAAGNSCVISSDAPLKSDPSVDIYSAPIRNSTNVVVHVSDSKISFLGRAMSDAGAHIEFISNQDPDVSHGKFVPIPKGTNSADIAKLIEKAINDFNLAQVTVTRTGVSLMIAGVQYVTCQLTNDSRVGQPTSTMCAGSCTDDAIGTVIATSVELDTALIQLDAGLVYRADIPEIDLVNGSNQTGSVKDTHDITIESKGYPLKKRGYKTGITRGTLLALDQEGIALSPDPFDKPPQWFIFQREYQHAFTIKGTNGVSFAAGGDSGSAVLNEADQVVGVLFGGDTDHAIATPILPVLAQFKLTLETAAQPGIDKTVPATQHAISSNAARAASDRAQPQLSFFENLRHVRSELRSTGQGRRWSDLVERHFQDMNALINGNQRVATVWRRNGGPTILSDLLLALQLPDKRIPCQIDGELLEDRLRKIEEAVTRYGATELSSDLKKFNAMLSRMAGLNYKQILEALKKDPPEDSDTQGPIATEDFVQRFPPSRHYFD